MNPRIRANVVKVKYRHIERVDEHLMSYPRTRNLVHFGSPEGTTYENEEEE